MADQEDGGADILGHMHAVYRTNTFPFIHLNFFHALMNIIALTPLLERFESEYGTLTSLALFFGREFSWSRLALLERRAR